MLSLSLIAAVAIGFVLVLILAANRKGTSSRSTYIFTAMSPLPLVLTVLIPLLINLATSFQGGRAGYAFSLAGCMVSFVFVIAGITLFIRSWMRGRSETLLIPATILSSIPALIIVFIYLFGFGGALRR